MIELLLLAKLNTNTFMYLLLLVAYFKIHVGQTDGFDR